MAGVIAAMQDENGIWRPEVNVDEDTRVSAYVFNTDINGAALTLTAIAAGEKCVVQKIEVVEIGAAGGILELQENGTAIWRKYIAASVHTSIVLPPLPMTAVGNVTITATAALTVDICIQGLLWTERTI